MCVCVCVCVCAGVRVVGVATTRHPDSHKRVIERLNKCRLVMVADMAIPRFLKGVQTA